MEVAKKRGLQHARRCSMLLTPCTVQHAAGLDLPNSSTGPLSMWQKKTSGNVEARSASGKMVDFYHVENYDKDAFLKAIKTAISDRKSPEFTRLYEFLLTVFVEEDHACRGVVNRDGFERLVNRAAFVPRQFGLAPPTASAERIEELYQGMEDSRLKGITFRKFLDWSVKHLETKVASATR